MSGLDNSGEGAPHPEEGRSPVSKDAASLKPLARRDGDPVFDEAWQAQALAMADCLTREGVFTPQEWAEALGVAVREQPDTTEGYYLAVTAALERLLTARVPTDEIDARRDAWARAYENTPHGNPVLLSAGENA